MAVKNNVLPVTLTSFNSTGLSGSYQAINSAGFSQPCFLIRVINDSDADITVSFDGSVNHDFVQAGTTLEINAQSNHQKSDGIANFAKGTQVSVIGSMGTGLIYLAGYYQN